MSEPISFDAFFAGVQRELNDGAGTLRITNTETHSDVYRTGDFIIEAIGQSHKAASLDERPGEVAGYRSGCRRPEQCRHAEVVALGASDAMPIR